MWQELNRKDPETSLHYRLRAAQILITTKSLDKTSGTVQPFQTCRNTGHVCGDLWTFPAVPDSTPEDSSHLRWVRDGPQQDRLHQTRSKDLPHLRTCPQGDSWERCPLGPRSLLRAVDAYYYKQQEENSVLPTFALPPPPLEQA